MTSLLALHILLGLAILAFGAVLVANARYWKNLHAIEEDYAASGWAHSRKQTEKLGLANARAREAESALAIKCEELRLAAEALDAARDQYGACRSERDACIQNGTVLFHFLERVHDEACEILGAMDDEGCGCCGGPPDDDQDGGTTIRND